MLRRILQPFYTAYVLGLFLISLFLVLPFYLLLSIPNNKKARRVMWYLTKGWATLWLWLVGMPVQVSGKRPPARRYVIVANHISYLDPILIFNVIPWYFRPLAKKEISKAPLFGFIYAQMSLMVDRSSGHSRAKSMRLMWRALRNDCCIFIYPEGTFNETEEPMKEFYDGAFRLAISAQVPILPMIFPDTVKRWHYSAWWKLWPGRNRAIYLDPVSVEGLGMQDITTLKEQVRTAMSEAMIRYKK